MKKKIALILIPLLIASSMALGIRIISAQPQTLKVGVIGPYNLPQWHKEQGGMEGGALLAMLDGLGNINVGGTEYQIELLFADEHALPLDEQKAYESAMDLCEAGCKFIIGGFRTEVTWKIIEAIKDWNDEHPDAEIIYLINGASTDQLISETVGSNYEGYKWLFRINPINSTMLGKNVFGYLAGYLIPYKLMPMYGTVKVGYLVENLTWTAGIALYVQYVLPTLFPPGMVNFSYGAVSPPGTTNFASFLDAAQTAGTHVLVIAYTLPDAAYLVSQWHEGEYKFLLNGIDVFGQMGSYPVQTGGGCEYEIFEDFSGTRSPITPMAVPFWDNFVGNYSAWPLYTAWGAYNAFISLKNALETAGTLDPDTVISVLEASDSMVLNGRAKFTPTHDIFSLSYGSTWIDGYTRAMMVQWIDKGGTTRFVKEVVSPIDQSYSRKTRFPPWIHPLGDWDLNFDGKVDIKDVARVSKAFGTFPGQPAWDVESDVNLDGKVDIKDVAAVSKNFGQYVSPWPPDP